MSVKATAIVLSDSKVKISYSSGPNADQAAAKAELQKVLATVVGLEVLSVSYSTAGDVADFPLHAAGIFEDATLVLQKGAGTAASPYITKSKRIENMSLSYLAAGGSSLIDISNADILAIATAFQDGSGVGGYSPKVGASRFHK